MHSIKINYKKVYETSLFFKEKKEDIDEVESELKKISDTIKDVWTGDDSHNFIESFNAHINDLENVKNYLTGTGDLLEKITTRHNDTNNEFVENMERSGM